MPNRFEVFIVPTGGGRAARDPGFRGIGLGRKGGGRARESTKSGSTIWTLGAGGGRLRRCRREGGEQAAGGGDPQGGLCWTDRLPGGGGPERTGGTRGRGGTIFRAGPGGGFGGNKICPGGPVERGPAPTGKKNVTGGRKNPFQGAKGGGLRAVWDWGDVLAPVLHGGGRCVPRV